MQGTSEIVELPGQDNTFGLGFKPSRKDRAEMVERKRQRRMARLTGRMLDDRMEIPPLSKSFTSAGKENFDRLTVASIRKGVSEMYIHVVDEDRPAKIQRWIHPIESGSEMGNWSMVQTPHVLIADEM